ncbi:OPT protein, partial [Glareola pratincola]|nr:OPT protein [Glareola pratincola]
TPAGCRMRTLAWVGITSLCLGAAWAVPAKEERRKVEKPKADLALYETLDLDSYDLTLDNYGEILDLSNYEELYDYVDLGPKIEVGTLAPRPKDPAALPNLGVTAETPKLPPSTATGPIHPAPVPVPAQALPSCRLCLCIGTSVYCDDANLEHIPPLPPETTYLYARFNRIGTIRASDFTGLKKLKRIDLTSNFISWADVDAFRLLPSLQELILPENRLTALPELPRSIVRLDARLNRIPSTGLQPEAFRDHSQVRRALEDIRLDGNPINLSLFPNAYFCLPRLPTGRFF